MEPHSRRCFAQNGTLRLPQALVLLLRPCLAGPAGRSDPPSYTDVFPIRNINVALHHLISLLNPFVDRGDLSTSILVGMVKLSVLCGIGSALWIWTRQGKKRKNAASQIEHASDVAGHDPSATDPGLLKKHSTIRSYTVASTGITYGGIRTFYRPHPQQSKLPQKPSPIPLLVFIHGLGGSAAQFHPILSSLSNLASLLAIDLPGCGRSSFDPTNWEAYTTQSLVQLLAVIIENYRIQEEGQKVVLIAHSMGCSLAAMLASSTSPYAHLISPHVTGLIAICPQADPLSSEKVGGIRRLTVAPTWLFDMFRKWDRRGGLNSPSVIRMTGPEADDETKRLQLRFNKQSRTDVWRRMILGMCPAGPVGTPNSGIPGVEVWSGLDLPVFLAGGENDHVTPPDNIKRIVKYLGRDVNGIEPPSEEASLPIAAAPIDPARVDPEPEGRKHQDSGVDASDLPTIESKVTVSASSGNSTQEDASFSGDARSSTEESTMILDTTPEDDGPRPIIAPAPHPRRLVVKTTTLPKPAAHSLLFGPSSSRIISGLIDSFLASHVDPRLSLAWQLQYLSTEGKWDVKNLEKWKAVKPVSLPIAGTFRAMKTLREVDEKHSPKIFVQEWASKLRAVVDISHDSPVYDPKGLEKGGIEYYKFPTVSKQPPTKDEVRAFIELIDKLEREKKEKQEKQEGLIGVHCHYGFNRTGFFVVSYLVEKLGLKVQDAIDVFEKARPPGIRHEHFINELHVRYTIGLKKAPTL